MSPHDEKAFQERLRALYMRTADEVDTATAARLRTARGKALAVHDRPAFTRWLFPLGAVATILLAAVVIWPATPRRVSTQTVPVAVSSENDDNALPPDPDSNDPALYQNLGFYTWLAQQPTSHNAKRSGG
ncbi:hypothetical protein [Oleiagrimonas sp.]|jgi:hypothetical protein|uniref:hypothetical protein n=1 Tax=Oleiagrimonas sp. TaxID=2010330 RepID=UPI002632B555|nr:hypothetical protein [Oleiagrimonas sp.]MDA3915251.1 hypothetical protein [Oleiagrimonas sp.]